ncbi:type I-E CRISPR-associated protein Cse2/CasB [Hoyosella sp. YIM 151337]|uniref:type I-E CRISPR-associated protein Cse2/CasB n=1 Tax=Hoyosella sp. YIM 151337 TaxID=2992742 RepID=UPI00223670C0|nr:type I-E CRISPR-associated protein Cse2/CasB [Hoyosella sp. YIM 151337]MCW4353526.1 type I-E CRISPR-associated protein Cse2/CasB [Hoyosella sp. YIM 151337]
MTESVLVPLEERSAQPPDAQLRVAVAGFVSSLQERYVAADGAEAGATLAKLRRAVTAEPGSVPEVWAETLGALPEALCARLSHPEMPTLFERAAHSAITLYALHQQSHRARRMHKHGVSLGTAARMLSAATGRENAVRSRFQAVALAQTSNGITYHLRALISMLRSEEIALDYGQIAVDLRHLYGGRRANSVRLRWGRDYHRVRETPVDLESEIRKN